MPVPRRLAKARLTSAEDISDLQWSVLTDTIEPEEIPPGWDGQLMVAFADVMPTPGGLKSAWATHGPEIVAEWARHSPGSRPSCWWRWSAPERERRVFAEPEPTPDDPDASPTRWDRVEETAFVETEAAYLRRHDLLLPGEAERIEEADFAPEATTRTRASWTCQGRYGRCCARLERL